MAGLLGARTLQIRATPVGPVISVPHGCGCVAWMLSFWPSASIISKEQWPPAPLSRLRVQMPFYRPYLNVVWTSNWLGVLYTACMLAALTFGKDQSVERRKEMSMVRIPRV